MTIFAEKYRTASNLSTKAETNGIVVLFPHLDKLGVAQPGGFNLTKQDCFDGYGFEGEGYDTKQGLQMRAMARMIEQVSGVDMLS